MSTPENAVPADAETADDGQGAAAAPSAADTAAAMPARFSAAPGQPAGPSPAAAQDTGGHTAPNPQLIQQTKQQIRQLVKEVADLSQSDCPVEEFYDGFLTRVVGALASAGGAIWTRNDAGGLDLQYQINLAATNLPDDQDKQVRHGLLLRRTLTTGESTIVQPRSGASGSEEAANDTDNLLVLGVVKFNGQVHGIVEIFQRPGGGPTTHRGYLRFLNQMCDLAGDYLKNQQLRQLDDRQNLWGQLEDYIAAVHHTLDLQETIYTLANEGRRVVEADRVSVAMKRGRKCPVQAVSGLDSFDRRSEEIKRLSKLAAAVVKSGEPLWYTGDSTDLPPQIEKAVHRYVDHSHARMVVVLPLRRPHRREEDSNGEQGEILGAIIIEQISSANTGAGLMKRAEAVASHGGAAVANALDHNSLFLLPLWRALGKITSVISIKNLPKTLFAVAAIAGFVAAMILVPYPFKLSSPGTLRPQDRQHVYAAIDGKLTDINVNAGDSVELNAVLGELRNPELEVEITRLLGRRRTTQEQILSSQRALLDNRQLTVQEENQISGQLAQLQRTAENIEKQLLLFREKQQRLTIRSPRAGEVATWQVRDNLLNRQVQTGQRLMTIYNPDGKWEIELHMPERRAGHIHAAYLRAQKAGEPVKVAFVLATHPGEEFEGHVVEIDRNFEVHEADGNTLRVRVAIDEEKLPQLRDGARLTAKVDCGIQPLGYVLFQDLIETVQAKVLFWL